MSGDACPPNRIVLMAIPFDSLPGSVRICGSAAA
jgi:hypothetical protein